MIPTSILISKFYHSQCSAAQAEQRGANWIRIDLAHDPADILFLPTQCTVRFDLAGFEDCVEQVLIEIHTEEVRFFQ